MIHPWISIPVSQEGTGCPDLLLPSEPGILGAAPGSQEGWEKWEYPPGKDLLVPNLLAFPGIFNPKELNQLIPLLFSTEFGLSAPLEPHPELWETPTLPMEQRDIARIKFRSLGIKSRNPSGATSKDQ